MKSVLTKFYNWANWLEYQPDNFHSLELDETSYSKKAAFYIRGRPCVSSFPFGWGIS